MCFRSPEASPSRADHARKSESSPSRFLTARTPGAARSVPYARYGETVDGVIADILALQGEISAGLDRIALQQRMKPGAARNALDCAFWDLEAKRAGSRCGSWPDLQSLRR
nr:hypothetical protein [Marinicella sp. W31]MDC2879039.1 hypothetical protein [Marinicella sp. W31]